MNGNIARNLRATGILITVVGALASTPGSADDVVGSDPWAMAPSMDVAAVKTEALDFAPDGVPNALQSGTVLMAVNVESSFEGALIHFHADGELALARAFALKEPPRLVIDLPGIRGDLPSKDIVLGGDFVSAIRVGVHPGKLRVVIDGAAGAGTFDRYRAVPSMDGLYLAIGEGPGIDLQLESRLAGLTYTGTAIADPGLDELGAEPILVAMTGTKDDMSLEDLWQALGEDPEMEALEAAVFTEDYLAAEPASAKMDWAGDSGLMDEASDAGAVVEVASAAPALDAWGLESAVVESPDEAILEEVALQEEAALIEEAILEEAALEGVTGNETASEEAFWARAGKPVETKISDLEMAQETVVEPARAAAAPALSAKTVAAAPAPAPISVPVSAPVAEPVQVAMVAAAPGPSAEPAWDPWALDESESGSGSASSGPAVASAKPEKPAAPVEIASAEQVTAPPKAAAPASVAPQQPAAPEAATEIFGLQFDRDSQRDRVAILGDRVADYELFEPDAQTLIILLKRSLLSEGMSERITPDAGGPISQVTIFQQPDIEGDEVRVVLRRADGMKPNIYQRGSLLLADFPNTGVAASLPVALIPEAASSEASDQASEADEAAESSEALVAAVVSASESGDIVDPQNPKDTIAVAPELINADGDKTYGNAMPGASSSSSLPGGIQNGHEFSGSPISLDFKDVPIMDVLRLIAEVSELNIIAGDEVKGTITLRLVEVPWDQALDIILVTRGLGYVRVGNVLRIAPAEALQAEEAERLQERRNKEQLEDLEVKLQPVNYAAVEDVRELVRRLLSPRGTVNTDERTNTVIIKDIPSVIAEATALIEALDTQTPQVMIEAKIVEAALDFGRELGTIWGVGTNPDAGPISTGGVTWDGQNNVAFNNGISSLPTGAASMGFLLLDDNIRVDVAVEAMEEAGEGKVISSPRVVTLDNREALIEQGVSIPFQTFEGGDAKLEFVDAVLSLKVTPHITPDESIIMSLEVTRNAPDSGVSTPTGSPAIAKNQAKTETLVKNGQTLVIGGIYTIDKSTTESRVPYLYKIPLLGAAFKSRRVSDVRKELLIFITPRIVVNPALADN